MRLCKCGCGEPLEPGRPPQARYRIQCANDKGMVANRQRIARKRKAKKSGAVTKNKSYKDLVECRCPRCEKTHWKKEFYTGKLPAKLYCPVCLSYILNAGPTETASVPQSLSYHGRGGR